MSARPTAPGPTPVRPILKWAGGKRQLLPALRPYYPRRFGRYFEPFLGSGAVFLDLHNAGRLAEAAVRLSDVNADVIGCYRAVRDDVEGVIEALRHLERGHRASERAHFYEVRDARFNPLRQAVRASADPVATYTPELAAMLIYLNRTGYNGLFRLNARGDYNVPAGRHGRITICDGENLRLMAQALGRPGLELSVRHFDDVLGETRAGDFVYLDPPYAPVSRTASFTAYTAARFGREHQALLQRSVIAMAERGVHVLLSNSLADHIRQLYADSVDARAAGLTARTVEARRAINSNAGRRGAVLEYVITNIGPAGGGRPAIRT